MSTDAQTVVAKETPAADPKIVLNELDSSASEGKKFTFSPLFEAEKTLTEAELRGEAPKEEPKPEEKTEAKAESKTEEKAPDEKPADSTKVEDKAVADKGTEGEPKSDAKPEEKSQDQGKPPKGFVPHQALAEERHRRQKLGEQVASLTQQVADLQAKVAGKKSDDAVDSDFKVLSEEEFEQLAADDPVEAVKYDRKLRRYEEQRRVNQQVEVATKAAVTEGVARIREVIPGVFDPESGVAKALTDFAAENGLDGQTLDLVTDPATRIEVKTKDGRKIMVPLGMGAAAVSEMIYKSYTALKSFNKEAAEKTLRETLQKEYDAKLETAKKELAAEIVKKIRTDPDAYRDVTLIPGAAPTPDKGGYVSEKQMRAMTPEQQRAFLGG